jgi:hypothetical protein
LFVPEVAVGSSQDRKILWIVGPEEKVTAREVTVGQKLGSWIAVVANDRSDPITAADRIVVRGLQRCREGKQVKPSPADDGILDVASFVLPVRAEPPVARPPMAEPAAQPSPGIAAPAAAPLLTPAVEPLPAPGEPSP